MKLFTKYDIPFVGLKNGNHQFSYNVDAIFFEKHEDSPIKQGDFEINLHFEKGNFFLLNFEIRGTFQTECDRCLEVFDCPVRSDYTLIVKYNDDLIPGEIPSDEDDDIVYISRNETHLNIAKYLYEFIVLSIPIRKVHPDDAEDNPTCEIDWEVADDYDKEDDVEAIDPRWEALKNIKNK